MSENKITSDLLRGNTDTMILRLWPKLTATATRSSS